MMQVPAASAVRFKLIAFATAILVLLVTSGARPTIAQNAKSAQETSAANSSQVARGKYIVESVAMCGNCHTPRRPNGDFDMSQWLQGGPVPFQPAQPDPNWPLLEPRIGGTPPASDAGMVTLLTTGIWTDGKRLRFPMPQFRMTPADAQAVVAYLKSINVSR